MPRETHLPHQTQAKQTVAEATEKLYEKKEPDNKDVSPIKLKPQ